MKWTLLVLCLTFLSAAAYAIDLPGAARREKARRRSSTEKAKPVRSFDDSDLEPYHRERSSGSDTTGGILSPAGREETRDRVKEIAFWRNQALRHQRELARLDAGIRRLEWRLSERRSKKANGARLSEDLGEKLLEDSIANLREQRRFLDQEFLERARKAGALPGWLR